MVAMSSSTIRLVGLALCCTFQIAAQAPPAPAAGGAPFGAAPPWAANMTVEIKANTRFDADKNGWLTAEERKTARRVLAEEAAKRPPSGLPQPRQGGEPTSPGRRMSPADEKAFPNADAFDLSVVRTWFLEFEDADWEKELTEFRQTDVDVPAKLTVDGQVFQNVGVHYRGASSFLFVAEGRKRSLNIKLDFVNKDQNFHGYRTFNLLNSNGDATLMKAVLYYQVAREYLPAAKVNFARVAINGEYWGVYANTQQEDRDFVKDWWKTTGGTRWKAPGSPWGRAGLNYLGADVAEYKKIYEIHTKDDPKAWQALMNVCRVLTETPLDKLESELAPIFDVDGALRFLALESTFINDDGYWVRASDYNLYLDEKGKLHIYVHDGNEAFYNPGANMRGKAAKGTELDPFIGSEDAKKVLLSRLVAVPALRARYLGYIRDMATKWLDWNRLGGFALKYQAMIDADVKADTRKLESYAAFRALVESDMEVPGGRGPVKTIGLKTFANERRAFLLAYPDIARLK